MRIEILKQFLTVAQSGSINSAAQKLFISQQGLDAGIQRLEKELGIILFQRTKKGVVLTADGKLFMKCAQEIVSSYNNFQIELSESKIMGKRQSKTVKIAVNPLLSSILSEFMLEFNNLAGVSYLFYELANEEIPQAVQTQKYDMGVICCIESREAGEQWQFYNPLPDLKRFGLKFRNIITDEIVVAVGRDNDLALKPHINDEDLANCNLTLSNNTFFHPENLKNKIILNSHDYRLHERYLSNNDCICVLPKFIAKKVFDLERIKLLHYMPIIFHHSLLISAKNELLAEETLFYNAFSLFWERYNEEENR